MRANEDGPCEKWEVIAEEDFEWMSIFACNANGSFKFVVLLVDVFINFGVM